MDFWSQSPLGINDPVQQEYWQRETQKLWEISTERNETFEFMTIDDVLQENALCKEENNRLNDIISEDIKQLKDNVTSLDNAIVANSGSIAENTDTITYVAATVEGNTAQITDMAENVDNLETMLEDYIHTQDVNSVRGGWCAFKNIWKTDNSIIKYDGLTFEDTNMDTTHTGTPLNIDTGNFGGKPPTKYFSLIQTFQESSQYPNRECGESLTASGLLLIISVITTTVFIIMGIRYLNQLSTFTPMVHICMRLAAVSCY